MSIKKSKLFSISLLLLILVIIIASYFYNNIPNGAIITNNKINTTSNTNTLTMMYETGPNTGEYQVSSDTTWPQEGYVFNDRLSKCENGSELSWDNENKRVIVSTSVSDKCYVYFDVYAPIFSDYIINDIYTEDGENGLYYHDGIGSYTNASQEAGDNSYRFSGANPNNYVCFGSDEETCPNDNLYRIIGVFNGQVKLIKNDYTTSGMLGTDGRDYYGAYSSSTSNYKGSMETSTIAEYRWNYDTSVSSSGSNNWTTSEFNTINLNTNYWNYLGATWQNLIVETTWHLGGITSSGTAKAFYDGERNNAGYGSNPTTYRDEIGLMYPSDYGYAASPDAWTNDLYDYDNSTITASNWLYMGLVEWTIIPNSSYSRSVFYVFYRGRLNTSFANFGCAARPVFYLKSNVALQGGTGTSSDPYRLAV